MEAFYFSKTLDQERTLCLAPLTDRRVAMSGQELVDASGYFLFESRGRGDSAAINIIAHVLSEEAALRLRDVLGMD